MTGPTISERILVAVGGYRDAMPPEAVACLQEIAKDAALRDELLRRHQRALNSMLREP